MTATPFFIWAAFVWTLAFARLLVDARGRLLWLAVAAWILGVSGCAALDGLLRTAAPALGAYAQALSESGAPPAVVEAATACDVKGGVDPKLLTEIVGVALRECRQCPDGGP